MAAGAYGAMLSLMHLLDNLQHPFRRSHQHLRYDRNQIETLSENLTFLLGFFEDYSDIICQTDDAVELARQIGYAVDEAEEIIDYHIVNQLSQGSAYDVATGLSSFCDDLERVLNKIETIKSKLMMVKDQEKAVKASPQSRVFVPAAGSSAPPSTSKTNAILSSFHEDLETVLDKIESNKQALMMVKDREIAAKASPQSRVSMPAADSSATPSTGKTNATVGFDDRLVHIMDLLTGNESDLQIVSITGMGGIGKTTLAQSVFDNRCLVDRFDLRKWITISQSYNIQKILTSLVGGSDDQILAVLGEKLHKTLYGRRYLIVMDDVWSTEVWGELRRYFPNNKNGSRVLVTTRLSKVPVSFNSHKSYSMPFLDKETSWKLFCVKAFQKEVCPNSELEEIGKDIVECCKGLPLAISTIGGLLGKSSMTRYEWELVAKDVLKSIYDSKDDGDCSNILFSSYKHLPIHLKPCFLYLRIFREDEQISADKLINYWVAEGFIKLKDDQTLEEVALEYLKDLIDRSLILIHDVHKYTGDISKCKVHDLLRDLCRREYENESFFVISKVAIDSWQNICSLCNYRESSTRIQLPQVCGTVVSFEVCCVCNVMCSNRNKLRLIKVSSKGECIRHTRLRYFVTDYEEMFEDYEEMFEGTVLSLLWNLQIFNSCSPGIEDVKIEPVIREMPQLRHLEVWFHPVVKDFCVLEKLQLLEVVGKIECWYVEEILKRIPSVKTLQIECENHSKEVHSFDHLHKLQRLICTGVNLEYITFPKSLKRLELGFCHCPWEGITIIGSLPNLEVLVFDDVSGGPEWNPIEGEFLRLKALSIQCNIDLVRWNAEKYHFPRLEILHLEDMIYLEEIPSGIGDIDTLREIRLDGPCRESLVRSAIEIVEEQRDCGNELLKLFTGDYCLL